MKVFRLFAILALTLCVMSCGGNKGFDKATMDALYEKVLNNSENYGDDPTILTTAIEQAEGLLNYFAEKYTPEQMKDAMMEVAKGNEPLGAEDTELYKCFNKMVNILYGQDGKMDDATKEAYAKLQEHAKAVMGN